MKHIIVKTFAAVLMAGGLTSCSDFLNQSSDSSLDGKNIFSTYEYAEGTIANIKNSVSKIIVLVLYGMAIIPMLNSMVTQIRLMVRLIWQHTMHKQLTTR